MLTAVPVDRDDAWVAIPLGPGRRSREHVASTAEVRPLARRSDDETPSSIGLLNTTADLAFGT